MSDELAHGDQVSGGPEGAGPAGAGMDGAGAGGAGPDGARAASAGLESAAAGGAGLESTADGGAGSDGAGRALVLGGGGITGVAWEVGVLAGLADHGVDLTGADLVIGTSAGSVVGVDVRSGLPLADFYQVQCSPVQPGETTAKMGRGVMIKYARAVAFTRDPVKAGRRIGSMALKARTESEDSRRKVFESRIPIFDWPAGNLKITAIDAATGSFTVFDANSGVSLIDAVGASCAVPGIWPPVTIDGKRYIDGGMRSATNADLAAGHKRVVIIAPLTQGFGPIASVATQIQQLTAQGSEVILIKPDKAALLAIGKNVLDPANRPGAAKAGYEQGASEAQAVAAVWTANVELAD
ncbi:MAG TPA: patatin-like phospholipase family protein [Streptosporangiaceae bacterium]|nr:patatin-like phospholipase family protein [Streptosporangiaceae bacterium]